MTENLGLVALARIQALEARPQAEEFRAKWLGGAPLDAEEAAVWLRHALGAGPDEVHFTVEELGATRGGSLLSDDESADAYRWLGWTSTAVEEKPHRHHANGPALGDLAATALRWVERYGWTSRDALAFALADTAPSIEAVAVTWDRYLSNTKSVAGPLSERITLTCRPQATVADVTRAYQHAQQELLRAKALAPRERTKPMTSPRRVDLAVMGARIYLGEFESWAAAMATYNSEHANGTESVDASYWAADQKGRFRKDVRDSFKQATGLDLDFQPDRRGTPPALTLDLQDPHAGSWNQRRTSAAPSTSPRRRATSKGGGRE